MSKNESSTEATTTDEAVTTPPMTVAEWEQLVELLRRAWNESAAFPATEWYAFGGAVAAAHDHYMDARFGGLSGRLSS